MKKEKAHIVDFDICDLRQNISRLATFENPSDAEILDQESRIDDSQIIKEILRTQKRTLELLGDIIKRMRK